MSDQRYLDYDWSIDSLHLVPDRVEDVGVGHGLEYRQLLHVFEDDRSKSASVYRAFLDHVRPSPGHLRESWTIRFENAMAYGVGVDGFDARIGEKLSNLALSRRHATAEHPTMVLCTHKLRR